MTAPSFRAACVQLRSGLDPETNVSEALSWIGKAAHDGADFVLTPETTNLMDLKRASLLEKTRPEADDPALDAYGALTREKGIWLLVGSHLVRAGADKVANRSFLFSPEGTIEARYDKIHMFDVDLPSGESYRESRNYRPGSEAVTAALPWGTIGLSVCYDLRFPYLYRSLAHAGAALLSVPAAFTKVTGEAHWHVLLRARAIETGSFVLAPAQGGRHETGRETYGHSLIVDPWGEILAEAGIEPGVIAAQIDLQKVDEARKRIPSLLHDREVLAPEGGPQGRIEPLRAAQ